MRTAEEWGETFPPSRDIFAHLRYHPVTEAEIRQIQLDAMREGMRRAAELSNVANPTGQMVTKSILSAAEQLTEKDL